MATCTTNGITVSVLTQFLPDYSNPSQMRYVFGYLIRIENDSPHTVQLMSRHWDIFDSIGQKRMVDGEGVVGLKPVIEPGSRHEYTSFCDLTTDMGKMSGYYTMVREIDGFVFQANIPEFTMVEPAKYN